jgi:hypothetical protein
VHPLQGKATVVTSAELTALLQDLYREKHALRDRHVAGAQFVSSYEFNNTYQYIIVREDTQLTWLRTALVDAGAPVPDQWPALALPEGKGDERQRAIVQDDVRLVRAFRERWAPRAAAMTHARHRTMCGVILNEAIEHERFFEQMLEGREDVLGRRAPGASTGGGVLATRWLE